jgi:hypothetical protein
LDTALLLLGDDLVPDLRVDRGRQDLLVDQLVLGPVGAAADNLRAVGLADAGNASSWSEVAELMSRRAAAGTTFSTAFAGAFTAAFASEAFLVEAGCGAANRDAPSNSAGIN